MLNFLLAGIADNPLDASPIPDVPPTANGRAAITTPGVNNPVANR